MSSEGCRRRLATNVIWKAVPGSRTCIREGPLAELGKWRTSNCSLLLIYLPRKDKRLSRPGWLTYSGRLTHISGHPSAAGRAQDRKSSPVKDQRSTSVPRNQILTSMHIRCILHTLRSIITSDKGGRTCFYPCSFVCLSVSKITQKTRA